MADAPAPQPDAEQQPGLEALETNAAESTVTAPIETAADAEPTEAADVAAEVTEVAETAAAPEPEPEPAPEPEPVNALAPQVASTTDVPASTAAAPPEGEGGEWELLVQKVKQWIASGQLQQQWEKARTPITLLAGLIAVLLVLRIYSSLLGVLESLPLLPGLLELVGVISVVRFSLTRLVKSDDRHEVIDGLKQRWSNFRGNR